jgi:hypothetical protein
MAKRESNAERRAAEDRRRLAAQAAFYAALLIDYETTLLRAGRGDKRYGTRLREGTADEFYDGERVREKVFYSIGERAYTAIGRLVCEHHDNENPSKFLRWVADYIEGKEPYNPGDNWYDDAIEKAYRKLGIAADHLVPKSNGLLSTNLRKSSGSKIQNYGEPQTVRCEGL